jgi:hypothetical protein
MTSKARSYLCILSVMTSKARSYFYIYDYPTVFESKHYKEMVVNNKMV